MTPEAAAKILTIPVDADRPAIEAAYRRAARLTHPDRLAGTSAGEGRATPADFIRAGLARQTLLAAVPTSLPNLPEPPSTPSSPASAPHRERTVMITIAAVLVVFVGFVLLVGLLDAPDRTNPGALPAGSTIVPAPQDTISGALILPIRDVPGIEARCHGKNACWVWSIVSKRACRGRVTVDFYVHQDDPAPAESATENVTVHIGKPAYVSMSSDTFHEAYAEISQYDCPS